MDRYGVIGHPIRHSRSPAIHRDFALLTGQSLSYERIEGTLEGFEGEVTRFFAAGGLGLNVTLPFKERAFALAAQRSPRAQVARAANTLGMTTEGTLWADNTDGEGLVRDMTLNLGVTLAGSRVLVLGAGGAARGIVQPLLKAGIAQLDIANRTLMRAQTLVRELESVSSEVPCHAFSWSEIPGHLYEVVINATSTAVAGDMPSLPAALFDQRTLAYDLGYGKGTTPFLELARQAGAGRTEDGLGMLVEQAAESFYLWRGIRPPGAEVLRALRAACH
ncbi:shikimate dehydrogenase [Ferrovum sp.]|uniref:shikimate dehydrogenase n=1 Tax=Ferrovum sp. TaxID=2609467 RepID=UPI00261D725D|nr:shikimate dehydrogenase [Ferrovum sp.]